MQIKRFEARDMTTALRLIKNELGPDAVILSARNLKKENKLLGLIKSVGVEVTAAVDSYDIPVESKAVAFTGALNAYRQHEPFDGTPTTATHRSPARSLKTIPRRKASRSSKSKTSVAVGGAPNHIFDYLRSHEVKPQLAADIVAGLNRQFSNEPLKSVDSLISEITRLVYNKSGGTTLRKPRQSDMRVLAVVGAAGVGKTATLAKLAARYAFQMHQTVALISLDSYRIGATAELEVYARAAEIPLKTVASSADFKAAVAECGDVDLILVDTPGINPANPEEIDALKACLEGIKDLEIHLVLSATTKESDLGKSVTAFNSLSIEGCIFTKLDESWTYGNLINLLSEQPLPLSYLASGRQMPEAIKAGSLKTIVEMVFKGFQLQPNDTGKPENDATVETSAVLASKDKFVVNKNSDVFHRINCKWTAKIKPENLITLSSADAARMKQFMPCRDCQPVKNEPAQIDMSKTRDSIQISNYS